MEKVKSNFEKLAGIDVSKHIEKKGNLSYLSWAWAVDQLLRQDPNATWEYKEPTKWGETVMVFCTVTAFGKPMTAQLPVMDNRNKAIANPDAFQINTAMQRCLAKAIALHGLGLYIYAGEDLPMVEVDFDYDAAVKDMESANSIEDLRAIYTKYAHVLSQAKDLENAKKLKDVSVKIADKFKKAA